MFLMCYVHWKNVQSLMQMLVGHRTENASNVLDCTFIFDYSIFAISDEESSYRFI